MSVKPEKFDSDEEMYMWAWLEEAKALGLVIRFKWHPKPFLLASKAMAKQRTVKRKIVQVSSVFLLHDHVYEYDFKVELNPKYEGKLFTTIADYHKMPIVANRRPDGTVYWLVDVKPSYMKDQGSNTRFPLNQKWVYAKFNLYVQKIVPEDSLSPKKEGFFSNTFVPKAYRYRPMKKRPNEFLKVKCKNIRTADEYFSNAIQ